MILAKELKMLTIISKLLVTSTLFCAAYGSTPLEPEDLPARGDQGVEYTKNPVSVKELESFLKSRYGSGFPENRWMFFSASYCSDLSQKPTNTLMAEKKAAIAEIPWIVTVAFHAFHQEQQSLRRFIDTPHIRNIQAISRIDGLQHYRTSTHPYFLRLQRMIMDLLPLSKEGREILLSKASYGASSKLEIGWLKDVNGIVPIPLLGKLKELYINHAPVPYGQWDDDYSRGMVFKSGVLTTSPGIYVHSENQGHIFKIIYEGGALANFRTYPITTRTTSSHPAIISLLSQKIFQHSNSGGLQAFIAIPKTQNENDEFEVALLETIFESKKEGNLLAITWLENYSVSLSTRVEELTGDTEPDTAAEEQQPELNPIDVVQQHIDSLYEKMVQAEQDAISKAVANQTAHQKPKREKAPVGKNKLEKAQETQDLTKALKAKADELEARKVEILAKIKTQGRQKWGGLISIIMSTLRPHTDIIEFNTRGSHLSVHIKGETESAGLTLIKPHGRKGGEIPAGVARNLATQLVELVMRVSAHSPEPVE